MSAGVMSLTVWLVEQVDGKGRKEEKVSGSVCVVLAVLVYDGGGCCEEEARRRRQKPPPPSLLSIKQRNTDHPPFYKSKP
jgi:hypothetical protein